MSFRFNFLPLIDEMKFNRHTIFFPSLGNYMANLVNNRTMCKLCIFHYLFFLLCLLSNDVEIVLFN